MKKQFLFGMAAVAALCSCSNNEVLEAPESLQTPIAFGTYVGSSVDGRAAVIDQTALESASGANGDNETANANKGFGVFAYYTEQQDWTNVATSAKPNFMYNQQVTKVSSDWTYSPLKYWPNNTDARVSFFAYAPYSASENKQNITITEQATMQDAKLGFTVNPTVKNQVDLLWAAETNKKKNSSTPVDVEDKVTFAFNHALARVGFTVQAIVDDKSNALNPVDANTTISVVSVELIGKFHKSGKIDLNTGNFESLSTIAKDYITEAVSGDDPDASYKREDYTSNTALATAEKTIGYGFELTNTAGNFESVATTGVTNTKKDLNTKDSYIMLIPQNFNSTNQVRIRVTYKVTTTDSALGTSSDITNIVTSSPFDFNFEAKKAYTFNLQLGMTSVKFSATVSPWDEVSSGTVVNVPINTAD